MKKKLVSKVLCLILTLLLLTVSGQSVAIGAETLHFIHQDHLGNTSVVTNESGDVVSRQTYYPYGTTRSSEGSIPTEKQYTGQVSDVDQTGLYYYNARYYNPTIAKFTQPDQKGDTLNKYSYVGNNPIVFTDPTGNTKGYPDDPTWLVPPLESQEKNTSDPLKDLQTIVGEEEIIQFYPELSSAFGYLDADLRRKIQMYQVETDIESLSIVVLCQFCYSHEKDVILMSEGKLGDWVLNMINTQLQVYKPGYKLSEGLAFLHEVRHFWQDYYLQDEFIHTVASAAVESGLLLDANESNNYTTTLSENGHLPIRPHSLLSDSVVSWSNPNEIDAIVAETMLNDLTREEFKMSYPNIWNHMLSEPGFFNPELFHQILIRTLHKSDALLKKK